MAKSLNPVDPDSGSGGVSILSINGVAIPRALKPGQVMTTISDLAYNRDDELFDGTITLENIDTNPVKGPLQIIFWGVPGTVRLVDATGNLFGTQYLTLPSGLAIGQSVTLTLRFKNPSNAFINLAPTTVNSGNFK